MLLVPGFVFLLMCKVFVAVFPQISFAYSAGRVWAWCLLGNAAPDAEEVGINLQEVTHRNTQYRIRTF